MYFHKHRSVLLGSGMFRKSSYYDPKTASTLGTSSYNKTHHFKEIAARLALGYLAGWFMSVYFFGLKKQNLNLSEEEEEAI